MSMPPVGQAVLEISPSCARTTARTVDRPSPAPRCRWRYLRSTVRCRAHKAAVASTASELARQQILGSGFRVAAGSASPRSSRMAFAKSKVSLSTTASWLDGVPSHRTWPESTPSGLAGLVWVPARLARTVRASWSLGSRIEARLPMPKARSDGLAAPRLRLTTRSAATRRGAWLIEALAGWMLDRGWGGAATAPLQCSGLPHRSQMPVAAASRA